MDLAHILLPAGFLLLLTPGPLAQTQRTAGQASQTGQAGQPVQALPETPQLIREVREHQKQLDKARENYTFTSLQTTEYLDADGRVTKTENGEAEEFFVNGHQIGRLVKKDGKPLEGQEQQKETERVTKWVEKAEKPEQEQPKEGQQISLSHVLEVADVRNPRRESYRGRPTIVFDFVGRKDLKAHGMSEDISKKLQGTVWIDEADRQVAHLEVTFNDNFHVGGGLVASVQKGSSFRFDQELVNGEVWLPTGGEGSIQARILLVKGIHQRFIERDYDYKRFRVETEQGKDAKVVAEKKP
ncbi:MAG: hypothetical protein ABR898_04735 [Terracidiphilus sp.]|jgi:hypothetical protein